MNRLAQQNQLTRARERDRYEHWKCLRLGDGSTLHSELCIVALIKLEEAGQAA